MPRLRRFTSSSAGAVDLTPKVRLEDPAWTGNTSRLATICQSCKSCEHLRQSGGVNENSGSASAFQSTHPTPVSCKQKACSKEDESARGEAATRGAYQKGRSTGNISAELSSGIIRRSQTNSETKILPSFTVPTSSIDSSSSRFHRQV